MAGVVAARLATSSLQCACLLVQPEQSWSARAAASAPVLPPVASTSQPWGHSFEGRWQATAPHSCGHSFSSSSCELGSAFFSPGRHTLSGSGNDSFALSGSMLTFTEKDVRRRGSVQCAGGKKVVKKKRSGAGAFGVGGAGPRETPAVLLRRAGELYETLMRPELLEEGLVREYVVCARLILGEEPPPDAVRNLHLLHDWLPVAELAFMSAQEDNVSQMLPLMKREICECVLRAVPQAKNVPRTMLEYAYEKRESFVKHVLENVDASGNREAGPSEQDPFAVLGLTRGASAQQVRTAYRAMAAIYHPDRNAASDASAKYMQVTKAYEQLKAGGGTAGSGFSAYASIGGRERDDLHGPIDMSKSVKAVGEGKEIAVRPLDEDVVGKFTARALSVALKRSASVDRTKQAQTVAA